MTDKISAEMTTVDIKQIAIRIQNLVKELNNGSLSISDKSILSQKISDLILRLESLKA